MYYYAGGLCAKTLRFNGINRRIQNTIQQICKKNLSMMETNSGSIFRGIEDRYKGITVDSAVENCEADKFGEKLKESLKTWKMMKKRGIWFKIGLDQSNWVPILTNNGFNFHHANSGYVMMYTWLPEESNNVPPYAHTMLAVGAIVMNDRSQVLVVKEKYFITSHWKLPGGLVDPGENLVDAAIREVNEETDISCEFHSIISFRHTHKAMFGCSDFYVVVSLKPLSEKIKKCDREIADCQWMDVDDYLKHSSVTELNKLFVQKYLESRKAGIEIQCKEGVHELLNKEYCVYTIEKK